MGRLSDWIDRKLDRPAGGVRWHIVSEGGARHAPTPCAAAAALRRFDNQGGEAVAPAATMSQFHTAMEPNILINSSRNEIKADTTVRGRITYEY